MHRDLSFFDGTRNEKRQLVTEFSSTTENCNSN